jgi:hypothetical protein
MFIIKSIRKIILNFQSGILMILPITLKQIEKYLLKVYIKILMLLFDYINYLF